MWEHKSADTNELDILGRDKFVDNCSMLIDTIFSTTKSAFIMIDGQWGVGKTFVMNMLDENLKDKYTVIKYNCWENSYYNDPLEAILSVMIDYIDDSSLWSNANKEKFRALGMVALNLLSLGSVEILNKAVEKAREYIAEDKNSIYTVIQEVKSYINSNKEKIIILVDEIDRCLPEYGVKTLERLYLLFKDAPNIVLVIANDKSKMEMSIKNAFGYKSIDNYLEKLIDYTLKLTSHQFLKSEKAFIKKYSYYFNKFKIKGRSWELFNFLFFEKDIRHIDKKIKKAYKIHLIVFNEKKVEEFVLMAELIIVELKKLSLDAILENYEEINTEYRKFHLYLSGMLKFFKSFDQGDADAKIIKKYYQNYLCFAYLTHLSEKTSSNLNLKKSIYFPKKIRYKKNILLKLKKFYDLSLIIE